MAKRKSATVAARLGGAIHPDGPVQSYEKLCYVWIDLPDGTTLSLFYNMETRLFVGDVQTDGGGIEFARLTVPTIDPKFRRRLARHARKLEREEAANA